MTKFEGTFPGRGNVKVRISNAWHRVAGRHIQSARGSYWNARNTRAIARGRGPVRARVAAELTSRTPVVRGRINPGTGRPRRNDVLMNRSADRSLARFKTAREAPQRTRRGRS